jgi:hypothetical protein
MEPLRSLVIELLSKKSMSAEEIVKKLNLKHVRNDLINLLKQVATLNGPLRGQQIFKGKWTLNESLRSEIEHISQNKLRILPPELWVEIFGYLEDNYLGVIRCVSSELRDFVDTIPSFTQPRKTNLSLCLNSKETFAFASKHSLITNKTIRNAITKNLFSKEIAPFVFQTIPPDLETMCLIASCERIDLLDFFKPQGKQSDNASDNPSDFSLESVHLHTLVRRVIEYGSDRVLEWVDTNFKPNYTDIFKTIVAFDFNDYATMKSRTDRFGPFITNGSSVKVSCRTMTMEDWIDQYDQLKQNRSFNFKPGYLVNFEKDIQNLPKDVTILDYLKQKIRVLDRFIQYFSKKIDYEPKFYNKVSQLFLDVCNRLNLVDCVKYLLFDLDLINKLPNLFVFEHAFNTSSPITESYAEFWFSQGELFSRFKHYQIWRMLNNHQTDLYKRFRGTYFHSGHPKSEFEFFLGESTFTSEPLYALSHYEIVDHFIHIIQTEYNKTFRQNLPPNGYSLFEQLFFKPPTVPHSLEFLQPSSYRRPFAFLCLYHLLRQKFETGRVLWFYYRALCAGAFGDLKTHSDIHNWLLSCISPFATDDHNTSKRCNRNLVHFETLDHLKQFLPKLLIHSPENLWPNLILHKQDSTQHSNDTIKEAYRLLKENKVAFPLKKNYFDLWDQNHINIDIALFLITEIKYPLNKEYHVTDFFECLFSSNRFDLFLEFFEFFKLSISNETSYSKLLSKLWNEISQHVKTHSISLSQRERFVQFLQSNEMAPDVKTHSILLNRTLNFVLNSRI